MPISEQARERDAATLKRLRLVISNPELAEVAYPDPEVRANVLPLAEAIQELADAAEKEN